MCTNQLTSQVSTARRATPQAAGQPRVSSERSIQQEVRALGRACFFKATLNTILAVFLSCQSLAPRGSGTSDQSERNVGAQLIWAPAMQHNPFLPNAPVRGYANTLEQQVHHQIINTRKNTPKSETHKNSITHPPQLHPLLTSSPPSPPPRQPIVAILPANHSSRTPLCPSACKAFEPCSRLPRHSHLQIPLLPRPQPVPRRPSPPPPITAWLPAYRRRNASPQQQRGILVQRTPPLPPTRNKTLPG